jgi:hypothetical protein
LTMPRLNPEDIALSMAISPRSPDPAKNEGLRTLLVHRLVAGDKAIARYSMSHEGFTIYCEKCHKWVGPRIYGDAPPEWVCRYCDNRYGIEFVVLSELEPGPGPGPG